MTIKSKLIYFLIGIVLAIIFISSPIYCVLHFAKTFVHEIGHSIFFWLFGYLALPAFHLSGGGGFSHPFTNQSHILQITVAAGIIYYLSSFLDKYDPLFLILSALIVGFSAIGFFEFHMIIIFFMGVGFEALAGGILLFHLFFGLNDFGNRNKVEAFFHAVAGSYLNLVVIKEFYLVINDPESRHRYINYSRNGMHNDFVEISNLMSVSLDAVCYFGMGFAILCLVIPIMLFGKSLLDQLLDQH